MHKYLFSILLILFSCKCAMAQAPLWQWAVDANSSDPESIKGVIYDPFSSNVYVGGYFNGNLSVKYGAAFTAPYGGSDAFIAKYDPAGNVVWAFKMGGTNNEEVKGIAVDPLGDVYVTGYFEGTADFDPSASNFNLTSAGNDDGFLAKYSSSGTFLWAVKFGGSNDEEGSKIAADANGIYVTGSYESIPSTFYSFSSVITKTTSVNDNQQNMFGAKYNASGIAQWVISGGSYEDDIGTDVIADASHVYFLGTYNHDILFKSATGVSSALLADQQHNKEQVYILAITQAGALGWQTNITSSSGGKIVIGSGITQDANNLYITGHADGNINFKYPTPTLTQTVSPGDNVFLTKLSKTGTFSWRASDVGAGSGDQMGSSVKLDNNGNLVVGGAFSTGLNYSSAGGPNFTSTGARDIFVTTYSNTGSFLWSVKAGGNNNENLNDLSIDNSGGIFLGGDHGGGAVMGAISLGSGGNADIYLAKLGCPAITNNTIASSQTICLGTAPSPLSGSLPIGGTIYAWQMSANSLTWTTASGTFTNQNYSPATLTATTYFKRNVTTSGTCTNSVSSSIVTISVNAPPSIANAGTNQTVCAATATLAAISPTIGTGIWSVITGTANITSISSSSSQVSALNTGTTTFLWTVINGVCPSATAAVSIQRDVLPFANAGTNQTVCAATATFAAISPTIGTGIWSVITGTSNITSTGNFSSQVTGLNTGNNSFLWTVANGVCPSATAALSIQRDALPSANAGTNQTVCAATATLAAISPTIGSGYWSVITGTANISSTNSSSSQVTGLNTGNNSFLWTVANGVCPSATAALSIQRDALPSANAGTNQTVCTATATLAAMSPTIGSGIWSVISGTSNITSAGNFSSQVTGLNTGNNSFLWTVANGVCPSATAVITIQRDALPSANAGTNQTVCAATATLAAISPTIGSGSWSVITGTANIASTNSSSSQVTGLSAGNNSFLWTVANGVCPSATAAVIIQRDALPFANAGTNQTVCTATATLAAISPTIGSGSWFVITGTANISSTNSSSSQVTGLNTGNNSFLWTVANGVCPSATAALSIQRDALPSANAGTNQTVCTATATLAAISPTIGSGVWSVITGAANIASTNSFSSQVTALSTGNNSYLWTVANGVCPSATAALSIQRDALPFANAGTNQTVCAATTSLSAISPTIGTGIWSVISGTSNITSAGNFSSQVTGLSAGNNSFLWTVANGVCPSATAAVSIQRDALPSANAGTNQTVCAATTSLSAISPTIGTGIWSVISGTSSITSAGNFSSQVTGLSAGNNSFLWTVANGVCPSATAVITIQRDALPFANAGTNQTICAATATLAALSPTIGSGVWSVITGTANITSISSSSSQVSALNTGTTTFLWTVINGVCPSATAALNIQRDALPSANAGTNQTICAATATLAALSPTIGSGLWSLITGTSNITSASNFSSQVTGLSTGNNSYLWTVTNGVCPSATAAVIISRDQLPSLSGAGSNFTVCASTCTLSANNPFIGNGTWSVVTGSAALDSPVNHISGVANLSPGLNQFIWTITNGTCPPSVSSVSVSAETPLAPAFAGTDQRVCSDTCTLNATNSFGYGIWLILTGNGTVNNLTHFNTHVSALSNNNTFVWLVSKPNCPVTSDTVNIQRDEQPSVSYAGPDQLICGPNGTVFSNAAVTGAGQWQVIFGPATCADLFSNQTSLSDLGEGPNTLVWIIKNGVCPPSADTLTIVTDLIPSEANAGENMLVCSESSTISALAPAIGTGSWMVVSGNCILSEAGRSDTKITLVEEGKHVLQWTVKNGVCPINTDQMEITRIIAPDVSFAGIDQVIEKSGTTLSAGIPTVGAGKWSIIEGSGDFSDVHDPFAAITNLSFGNTILSWTTSNGLCAESRDDMSIYVRPLAIPNAFSPNNDGVNDRFVAISLEYYTDVKFTVFNRWGALLFKDMDYKNDWAGTNLNNEQLADDTYYYIMEIAGFKSLTGYIILKKDK